jgi:hypothetical protein
MNGMQGMEFAYFNKFFQFAGNDLMQESNDILLL